MRYKICILRSAQLAEYLPIYPQAILVYIVKMVQFFYYYDFELPKTNQQGGGELYILIKINFSSSLLGIEELSFCHFILRQPPVSEIDMYAVSDKNGRRLQPIIT